MSCRHRWYCTLVVAGWVVVAARSSPGQGQFKPPTNRGAYGAGANRAAPNRPMPPQPMPVTVSGTLQQIKGGLLQVASATQEQYLVKVDPRHTKVQCTGTAEPDFLRSGLYVRFSGEFDNRGTGKGDLSELEIVTPSEIVRPGVVRDEPGGLDEKPKKKVKNEGGKFLVVGQIRSIKNGQLLVAAPTVPTGLKVNVAAGAKINVDVNDVTLAQQGDEIEVKGNLVQPAQNGQPGQVVASEVTIKLAKPLSALSKKKVPRALATPRSNKKTDKSEQLAPPGAAPKPPGK
jgi:hypothetical protein